MNPIRVIIIPVIREKPGKSEYSPAHTAQQVREIYDLGAKYEAAIRDMGINCKFDDSAAPSIFKGREYEYQKIPVFVMVSNHSHPDFNIGTTAWIQTLEMRLEKDFKRIPACTFEENLAIIKIICERQIISNNIVIIIRKET